MINKLIFLAVFVATFFVRLDAIRGNNLPFTTDQGRDMIDIRSIAIGHKPRLIGPTTSINGVYLGPFWYYFNLPPFVVSGGDPASLLTWQIVWYQLVGLLTYVLSKKINPTLGFLAAVLFLIMPLGFNTSRYSWNANAMPTFSAFYILALQWLAQKQASVRSFLVGLLAGLSFQIEAAFGIIFFPFSFLYFLVTRKSLKTHLYHLLGFLLTLLPQGVFELRHQFPLTKVFLAELYGKSTMLGEKLAFQERITDRLEAVTRLIQQTSHLPVAYLYPVFGIVCFIGIVLAIKDYLTKANQQFVLLNFSFIVFSLIFYFIFPQPLKSWYLLGLSVPLVFLYSSSLASLLGLHDKFISPAIVLLLAASFYFTFTAQSEYLSKAQAMGKANKSSLVNSRAAVDWVYTHAGDSGFKVYSYLPSIYDYPYQYLFWWHGEKKYGYRANDVSYLPNQPEYIENMRLYFTDTKPLPANEPTFLIIEREESNPSFQLAWLGNFSKLCQVDKVVYDYGVEIRKLLKCQPK